MSLTPMGALPARFRRTRVLILGCGDVGGRVADLIKKRVRVVATTSNPGRIGELRAAGLTPALVNLDQAHDLSRWSGWTQRVLHTIPPNADGHLDERTRRAVRSLRLRGRVSQGVYVSTTGVYGDRQGAWVRESDALRATTPRAQRRVDAEAQWRAFIPPWTIIRAPGIYALDREGGNPLERLNRGTPVLAEADDVYTNRIHSLDLARACVLALWSRVPYRAVHVCDQSSAKLGDYFVAVAEAAGLPPPQRISLAQAKETLSPMALSFWRESRRLRATRMEQELKLKLKYPSVFHALAEKKPATSAGF